MFESHIPNLDLSSRCDSLARVILQLALLQVVSTSVVGPHPSCLFFGFIGPRRNTPYKVAAKEPGGSVPVHFGPCTPPQLAAAVCRAVPSMTNSFEFS